MITIFAIDPGGTTGYAFGTYQNGELFIAPGQAKLSLGHLRDMITRVHHLGGNGRTHVIYEDFEYRNLARRGLDLTPVKLIGVIEMMAEDWSHQIEFHKQSAAQGKAHFTDDKLKYLNLYEKSLKHGRDATRHLLHWVNFHSPIALENPRYELVEIRWLMDTYYNGARF